MRKHVLNEKLFDSIQHKEVAYFLGFLWADGTIRSNKNRIKIYANKEDLASIKSIFDFIGSWCIWESKQEKAKDRLEFSATNEKIYNFLVENDFLIKSQCSPDKILKKIPKHLHSFFYRGWFDGDGCISHSNKKSLKLCFAGSYQQDWSALIGLSKELNLSTNITRIKAKNGNSSYFNITNRNSLIILGDYLFNTNIGLKRKHLKYLEILNIYIEKFKVKKGYYFDNYYQCYKLSDKCISTKQIKSEKEAIEILQSNGYFEPYKKIENLLNKHCLLCN